MLEISKIIFFVGRNKTGTTSLKKAFKDLGCLVQQLRCKKELFDRNYFENNLYPTIKYCRRSQVFQDAPFSHFNILKHLDQALLDSKFILTERDEEEQWYRSLTKFHSKLFGKMAGFKLFLIFNQQVMSNQISC